MPHSTVSSEPLTSPTPSPPPSAPPKPSSTASARAAGLESGSELSELSDDGERDPEANDEDDDDDDKTGSTRGIKTRSRRTRGGVVPGDMWDWAYKAKKVAVPPDDDQHGSAHEGNNEENNDETRIGSYSVDPENREEHESDVGGDLTDQAQNVASTAAIDEEKDQGKGEDDMEIDSSEGNMGETPHDNPPNDLADNPENLEEVVEEVVEEIPEEIPENIMEDIREDNPEELASSPHSSLEDSPVKEDVDGDVESDVDVDEQDPGPAAEDSLEEDEDDIASSRPSSPGTEVDIDVEAPPTPPIAKIVPSSSLSAPMTVPVPVMHPSPEADIEDDALPDVDGDLQDAVEQEDGSRSDNEEQANDKPDADVDVTSPTPEPSSRSPTPEHDLLDLQPAHRAEALDALALIELKFALLRERLYVEKMEELVEEESMVLAGTHPELLHLQLELSLRRDKRLELAARRRAFEEASIHARKRDDQNGVWEWWKYERDNLQTDMISQHNRKRRKLERQRRSQERPLPPRRIPPPPQPRLLPPAPPLASVLDFDTRTPYAYAFQGQRPARPELTMLTFSEIEADLGYITGGKRRFWSVDGSVPNETMMYANGSNGEVIGGYMGRDLKERERERMPKPAIIFEQPQSQHFRTGSTMFGPSDEPQGPGQNGWSKRRVEEETRNERDRDRDRAGQRQAVLPLHSHPHQHTLPLQQQQHPQHTMQQQQQQQQLPPQPHHTFSHSHQHSHAHTPHVHPHPHHHHVHIHHHHHQTGPGGPSASNPLPPPSGYSSEKHGFPHGGPGVPPSEKGGNLWRGDETDGVIGYRDRERDRERERKGGPPPSTLGYDRVMSSSFGSPSSPQHHQRHDSWEELQGHSSQSRPQSQPPPPGRSPAHPTAQTSSGRLPTPHTLSHRPHSRQNSLGSSPTRRQAPESPPQTSLTNHNSSTTSNTGHQYPPSPRSIPINPVLATAVPPPPKTSSSSRPISPVQVKMVSGTASTSASYPSNTGSPASRRGGEPYAVVHLSGSRADLFSGSAEHARSSNTNELRTTMLTGIGGGSAAEAMYPRDRRDRPF